jgi:hypothetical protein
VWLDLQRGRLDNSYDASTAGISRLTVPIRSLLEGIYETRDGKGPSNVSTTFKVSYTRLAGKWWYLSYSFQESPRKSLSMKSLQLKICIRICLQR